MTQAIVNQWCSIASVPKEPVGLQVDLWGYAWRRFPRPVGNVRDDTPRRYADCVYLENLGGWYNQNGERIEAMHWMIVEGPR